MQLAVPKASMRDVPIYGYTERRDCVGLHTISPMIRGMALPIDSKLKRRLSDMPSARIARPQSAASHYALSG